MAKFILSAFCDECGESSIEGQMKYCQLNDITHMELRGFGSELNINNLSVSQAKEMKKKIDAAGMKVGSLGTKYGKISITDDFEPHFEAFKNTCEVAKILGTKYIRIFSFYFNNGERYDEYRSEVINRVQKMADYAVSQGLLCCHENEKGIYGDNEERCLDLLQNVKNIRGVFDPANFVQCGVDTLKAYEMLEPYIEYMHVKDAMFETGKVVPAGKGEGNVEAIIKGFDHKRQGEFILSLEPHLTIFDGLSSLEQADESLKGMEENTYPNKPTAFMAAADALKHIINN